MWCAFSPWQGYNLQGWVQEPVSFEGSLSLVERNCILSSSSASFLLCEATWKGSDNASPDSSCHHGGIPFRSCRTRTIEHHTPGEFVSKQGGLPSAPKSSSNMCISYFQFIFNQWRLKAANIWNNIAVDLNPVKNSSSKSIAFKLYLSMLEHQFGLVKLRILQSGSSMKNIAILNTVFSKN